jgi:Tfp pilus assembly protein PilF
MKILLSLLVIIVSIQMGCSSLEKEPQSEVQPSKESIPKFTTTESQGKAQHSSGNKAQSLPEGNNLRRAQVDPDGDQIQQFIKSHDWQALGALGFKRLEVNAKDIKALNILGLVNYYQNKPLAAKYYFNRALELSPNNGVLLNNLGLVYRLEGNSREAIQLWRRASESTNQKSLESRANLVTEFAKGKDYKKIMGAADRIDYRKINNVALLVNLGLGYMAAAQYDMAERVLTQALELDDLNRTTLLNFAILNIEHERNLDLGRRQLDRLSFLGVQSDMQVTVNRLEAKLESVKTK